MHLTGPPNLHNNRIHVDRFSLNPRLQIDWIIQSLAENVQAFLRKPIVQAYNESILTIHWPTPLHHSDNPDGRRFLSKIHRSNLHYTSQPFHPESFKSISLPHLYVTLKYAKIFNFLPISLLKNELTGRAARRGRPASWCRASAADWSPGDGPWRRRGRTARRRRARGPMPGRPRKQRHRRPGGPRARRPRTCSSPTSRRPGCLADGRCTRRRAVSRVHRTRELAGHERYLERQEI